MNLQDRSIKFLVYKHTCPNGKMYVGITSRSVSERWGKYGYRYKKNRHFWNAIMKYGWDNIKHEILATNLTLEEAGKLEQSLIQQYQLMDRRFGYNNTSGGEVGFPSDEVRVRLKQIAIEHSQDPEFCKKISNGLKGHIVTEECKRKRRLTAAVYFGRVSAYCQHYLKRGFGISVAYQSCIIAVIFPDRYNLSVYFKLMERHLKRICFGAEPFEHFGFHTAVFPHNFKYFLLRFSQKHRASPCLSYCPAAQARCLCNLH